MATPIDDIVLCAPVRAELLYGALRSAKPNENILSIQNFARPFSSLSFDDAAADHFSRIRLVLETQGAMIGPYDLQIASIAIANRATLVSHNTREFRRVPGLLLEDWEA